MDVPEISMRDDGLVSVCERDKKKQGMGRTRFWAGNKEREEETCWKEKWIIAVPVREWETECPSLSNFFPYSLLRFARIESCREKGMDELWRRRKWKYDDMKGQGQGQVGERNERKEKKTKQGNFSV